MAKQKSSLGLIVGAVVLALVLGLIIGGQVFSSVETVENVVYEDKLVYVNETVEVPFENTTKLDALQAQLDANSEFITEGQYEGELKDLALEELEDEMDEVEEWLMDNKSIEVDEEDISYRVLEDEYDQKEWEFDYDKAELLYEDEENVDADVFVNLKLKGRDVHSDKFSEYVRVKFEFEDGKMRLKDIESLAR